MTGQERVPIGDHGLIGDTRTAALVAPDGAIDWCCLPRFDGEPVFGTLVGGPGGGEFKVAPSEPSVLTSRRYRADSATVVTTWRVDGGELELADSMVADVEGDLLPGTLLVRRLSARGRAVEVAVSVSPRFGTVRRRAQRVGTRGGALVFEHGGLAFAISCDGAPLRPEAPVRFLVAPTEPVTIALAATSRGPLVLVPPAVARGAAEEDERRWQQWSESVTGGGSQRGRIVRSLLTLRLLTYSPSGAPVAAPITSLPEALGGGRNWDYRFAWPRDASLGVGAFLHAGLHREAQAFFGWLLHASRTARPRLPALFTLDGRPAPGERELPGWPGYAGSAPVRVGNGANHQHQLDGYGWVLDAAWKLTEAGHQLDGETWRAMTRFADHVADTWRLPDAGIWERRDDPRHNVHSKAMAWLALDRAARLAAARTGRRAARRAARWSAEAGDISSDITRRGYSDGLRSFTAAYGTADLDAALLVLPSIGLDIEPERLRGTVSAIREKLSAGGPLLYRYLGDDGLEGAEGAFLPCSFWLVEALALLGERDEAVELFEQLLTFAGPLGLFAEEADPGTGEQLGNFPQALTHAALVHAAYALTDST